MPPETTWIIIAAIAALGCAVLFRMQRSHRARSKAERGALFAPSYGLFDRYQVTQTGLLYPELSGRYRGLAFHLDAVVDTLTFRKVPVLWLRVSLLAPLPGLATFDVLVRSQNVEFYSPSNDLPHQLRPLPSWPADAMVRTDDPERLPDLAVIDRHMPVFDQKETKELLITPKGVRIVHMLEQARRAEYLVLRQAEFEKPQVAADTLRALMDRTIALHEDLIAARKPA